MSNYKLDDGVADYFNFELFNKKFRMKYPITSEVESIQELSAKIEDAQAENRKDEVKGLSTEMEDILYGFIEPVEHDTPIREVLKSANLRVMRNFNTMIKTELSIQ